jgi:hypothetical protein
VARTRTIWGRRSARVEYATHGAAAGFFVEGVVDPSLSKVRVVDT